MKSEKPLKGKAYGSTPMFPESECSCKVCINMCKCYPCQPTPKEAQKLMDLGYAKRMMLKAWPAKSDPKLVVPTLCPAIIGYECGVGPLEQYKGKCTFLTSDNLCEIHSYKPSEGRFAHHNMLKKDEEEYMGYIMNAWMTCGDTILERWEKLCNVKIQEVD